MSDKRRGLGRGLGALIPSSAAANASGNGAAPSRPVDLFFPEARDGRRLLYRSRSDRDLQHTVALMAEQLVRRLDIVELELDVSWPPVIALA